MKKEDLRIVYMGTPDFAVESLRALVEGGYNIVGVVTMPDKPMGRHGSVLQASAVKQYAQSVGLPVLQPEKLKDEGYIILKLQLMLFQLLKQNKVLSYLRSMVFLHKQKLNLVVKFY